MNSPKQCRWCLATFRTTAKGLAHHESHCDHNPNPAPVQSIYEPKQPPGNPWTCPGCGKTTDYSRRNIHRCPQPKTKEVREGRFKAAVETMRRNDRKRQRRPAPTECPRCHQTPCATPDACGRAIRADSQHAGRLAREAAELGRKQTN